MHVFSTQFFFDSLEVLNPLLGLYLRELLPDLFLCPIPDGTGEDDPEIRLGRNCRLLESCLVEDRPNHFRVVHVHLATVHIKVD